MPGGARAAPAAGYYLKVNYHVFRHWLIARRRPARSCVLWCFTPRAASNQKKRSRHKLFICRRRGFAARRDVSRRRRAARA
ncbi:hypothetical protein AZ20_0942 [Bordetella bronchiseptica E014]|nr:hypothetical protein L576_1000 [Bordetella bronchiseptica OSU054]KAK75401.1 hypothetical protein L530_0985 [Bordetella bronchiseptica MO211]KAK78814.1 hypothetical protein L507_0978 [Bordetella bronchiseptica CA90 BB02]KCV45874.1 hypothetical protein L572_1093 [Bordetella bronchiseptica 345]KDB79167.1 hypothetical protein L494_0989 [Bordetella bronchiseptica CA90 BB1334]KDC16790.1 hypothetical protein AZ20_0942 [Bordetella bronchiseptica E014]KDC21697.1 hypothetical protein L542_1026 [Bord